MGYDENMVWSCPISVESSCFVFVFLWLWLPPRLVYLVLSYNRSMNWEMCIYYFYYYCLYRYASIQFSVHQ